MRKIFEYGLVSIWEAVEFYGSDYYVYRGSSLIRVCPSLGMAREVAAGAL
jgi:hypothetical protein